MRKAILVLIASLLALSAIIGTVVHWDKQSASQATVTWGGPSLCVSEREHFRVGMESLLDTWEPLKSRRRSSAEPAQDLVIDLENRLLWLTHQGVTTTSDYVELPAGLSWKLYACSGHDVDAMPPLVCLRPAQRWHGTLALAGYGSDGVQFSCALHGPYLNGNVRWGEGEFNPKTLSRSGPPEGFSSILITDQQRLHQIAQTRPASVTPENALSHEEEGLDPLARHRTIWRSLQKPLYQALEQEAIRRGYEVTRISVQPGPDYTAGLAGIRVQARPVGRAHRFWSFLRRRNLSAVPYFFLTVDALGDGRWHCLTTQIPKGAGPRRTQIEFDFYVEQAERDREVSLPRPEPQLGMSPWSVVLDGGTCVELIGVCANSGSTWWAPDGSALEDWPGFFGSAERQNRMMFEISARSAQRRRMPRIPSERDEKGTAVILRVPSSVGFGNSSGRSSSGSTSVYSGSRSPLLDRFGVLHSPGQYVVLSFDALEQDSISHALGIRVGGQQSRPEIIRQGRARSGVRGGMVGAAGRARASQAPLSPTNTAQSEADSDQSLQWIQLKKLSLHPGRHTEFEMILTEDAGEIASTSKVQVRP